MMLAIQQFLTNAIPFGLALAVLIFCWGLLMYLLNPGEKEKRDEGVNIMVLGTVLVFLLTLAWALFRWVFGSLF